MWRASGFGAGSACRGDGADGGTESCEGGGKREVTAVCGSGAGGRACARRGERDAVAG